MAVVWTAEKLAALDSVKLENVRRNALKMEHSELVRQCEAIQQSRKSKRQNLDPVVGFHFVCKADYEVDLNDDGTFWSGVWIVDEQHCEFAVQLGGYVALHERKSSSSYRQGQIVGWELRQRTKGNKQIGVAFRLRPLAESVAWYGKGSGERGYRRVSDSPRWDIVKN